MAKRAQSTEYYLRDRGKIIGRFTLDDLAEMKIQGRLSRFSRVSADKSKWVSFEDFMSQQVDEEEFSDLQVYRL